MATQVQNRRGSTAEHSTFTGAVAELTVDTDKDVVVVHDGSTAGGHPMLKQDLSNLPAGTIDNADINASAAIAGTKISPNFGSQNVTTTGTATAAALIPSGSSVPTNGVYLPSANNVAISTNGTGRLFVNSSGQVGLGTTPQEVLDVNGRGRFQGSASSASSGAGLELAYVSGSTTGQLLTYNRSTSAYLGTNIIGNPLTFSIGTTEAARIDSSGRLGLGTSTPEIQNWRAGTYFTLANTTTRGQLEIDSAVADSGSASLGALIYSYSTNTTNHKHVALIEAVTEGATANQRGGKLTFYTKANGTASPTAAVTIDSSQRVGIGVTGPSSILDLNGAITLRSSGTVRGYVGDVDADTNIQVRSEAQTVFKIGNNEAARIDASRRLLVGTSTAPSAGDGQYDLAVVQGNTSGATGHGSISIQRGETATSITSGEDIGYIKFNDSSGNSFAQIRCTADANAGSGDYPGRLVFSTSSDSSASPSERLRITSSGNLVLFNSDIGFYPATDNAYKLGETGARWSQVWAANGTIQTSDERAKTEITDAQLGSDFIKSLRPVSYKWIEGGKVDSGNRDEKGNYIYESVPGQRTHWGFIAQEVKQAVDYAGVDFGGWVLTDKDDPDSQQALRYDQFIAPLTKALQEALAKIETLEAKVNALEGN